MKIVTREEWVEVTYKMKDHRTLKLPTSAYEQVIIDQCWDEGRLVAQVIYRHPFEPQYMIEEEVGNDADIHEA